MSKWTHFFLYNNTVPIIFGILFLGAGATYAASPEARSTVVRSETSLYSIDNSYLIAATVTDESVIITIGSVTENEVKYFVEYQMSTIGVQNGVWQPVTVTKTLEVRKDTIIGRDLGLYVAEELSELHAYEVRRLKETQETERMNGLAPKVVATEYSGLVGRYLSSEQEVFPGYDPLIDPATGIPLTPEQKAAHEAERKRIEEQKEKEITVTTDNGNVVTIPPIGGGGAGEQSGEESSNGSVSTTTTPTEPPAEEPTPVEETTPVETPVEPTPPEQQIIDVISNPVEPVF
ncbi:MAG: hypothetical protein RLZZ480_200 [Candidatus Parcubacteria bacterium]|jgi:hypothetical protein